MLRLLRVVAAVVVSAGLFVSAWLIRFNDPDGSYAGLTDDHFFYLARGWQILFGDLPVRDFVDQGAPLYYYVGAAVQLFGRGTLSELVFSVTVLAAAAVLVFRLAAVASGSILAGLLAAWYHVQLAPRLYNYPKIVVYAIAIPLLWRFADAPTPLNRFWLALITVVGFLFRHDHGVFVAAGTVAMLLLLSNMPRRDRLRHAVLYAGTCAALLLPYVVFVQANGGVVTYGRQVAAWAARERARTPVEWPGLFDYPDGASDVGGTLVRGAVVAVQDNMVAWVYYLEIGLPIVALVLLGASSDGFRRRWPRAREKLAAVAILALVLDAGFLRSPLEARLADPSVPQAILLAWLVTALPRLMLTSDSLDPSFRAWVWPIRFVSGAVGGVILLIVWSLMSQQYDRRDRSFFANGPGAALERASAVAARVQTDWDIGTWPDRPDRPELMDLSAYVNACTAPGDRVFVQAYMPQVLALARRAFAGGHADLRPGFFVTPEAQRLTVERLQRQAVPIMLLETDAPYDNFRESFPLVTGYIDRNYAWAGARSFDGRYGTALYVRRDRIPSGTYMPLGWPCFGPGVVRP